MFGLGLGLGLGLGHLERLGGVRPPEHVVRDHPTEAFAGGLEDALASCGGALCQQAHARSRGRRAVEERARRRRHDLAYH